MKKFKVAIISTGASLESIIVAMDFDDIEICALFGFWNDMSVELQNIFHKVFQPLDMLSVNCTTCGADYFLVDINESDTNATIRTLLVEKGIDINRIVFMDLFGSVPQFNFSYLRQWKLITENPVQLDFIVTGLSYVKDGFDVATMQPWRGVNFARSSQDLYYGYKMVEAYLNTTPPPS